jgi:DNA-directed RNA polymerase subunit RPC12/RpoP
VVCTGRFTESPDAPARCPYCGSRDVELAE